MKGQEFAVRILIEEGGVNIIIIWLAGACALALALARFIRAGKGGDE